MWPVEEAFIELGTFVQLLKFKESEKWSGTQTGNSALGPVRYTLT